MSTEPTSQQAFLRAAKERLGVPWDELARLSGIAPRALKTYRMPESSADHRPLPPLAKAAIERLLLDTQALAADPVKPLA